MEQKLNKARIQELIETLDTMTLKSIVHNGYDDACLVYAINIFLHFMLDKKWTYQSKTSSPEEMMSGATELGTEVSELVKKHTGLDKEAIKDILTKLKK